ncbi:hypothetical protein SmJEL517_g03139 [Synchytrium microbalum]|uniref:NADH:flavin oxidoreductase/NADH oxidase N-terminal domain-containing protein n=1 Tax=Synchytrium microbalum TaxID=1806994 RepID=A0A507C4V8_9FUNG|nr:uncharacterized protein SmJEL517_g03139 [Synchytrium microbalum]TPX34149.1 hypothetical protein SmJEL517_g03139 [Synchytrium microbalum]
MAAARIMATSSHLAATADLFAPITFSRGPNWKNRFMLAPLTNTQSHPDGVLSDDEYNWLVKRAEGGHGLVMTCAAHVQKVGQGFPGQLGIWSDHHIDGLTRLADGIRKFGAVSSVQLHHAGIRSPADLIGETPVGPSATEEFKSRALTLEEVEQLKEDFIVAAVRAEKAGFDGVEIHGAHGYIICAFLSSEYNQRTDAYGGSLMNRAKLLLDIMDGIRERCRPDFQLGLRLSPERFGLKMAEQIELVKTVMATGKLDYLELSLWSCFTPPAEKEYAQKPLIAWFADIERNGCRLGAAGKLYTAAECRRVLEEYKYDFVVMGRASIIHHDFPKLVKSDPNFGAMEWPVPKAHFRKEAVSDTFITYLGQYFKAMIGV